MGVVEELLAVVDVVVVDLLVVDVVGRLVATPEFALCLTFFLPLFAADFDDAMVALFFGDVDAVLVLVAWPGEVGRGPAEARKDGSGGNAAAGAGWSAASTIPTVIAATTITTTTDTMTRRLRRCDEGTLVVVAGGTPTRLVAPSWIDCSEIRPTAEEAPRESGIFEFSGGSVGSSMKVAAPHSPQNNEPAGFAWPSGHWAISESVAFSVGAASGVTVVALVTIRSPHSPQNGDPGGFKCPWLQIEISVKALPRYLVWPQSDSAICSLYDRPPKLITLNTSLLKVEGYCCHVLSPDNLCRVEIEFEERTIASYRERVEAPVDV